MIKSFFKSNAFIKIGNASMPFSLAISVTAIMLSGCMVKEKPVATLHTDRMTPPWDSTHFSPRSLRSNIYEGTEGVFDIFHQISRMDSLAGSQKSWSTEPEANDTMRISQMFDSNFIFPQNPEATMPYGYDDSFRDDTLFRNAYGNGLFTQDHPCATTFVLSKNFLHPARWLKQGLTENQIIAAIGNPLYKQPGILRYLTKVPGTGPAQNPDDTLNTTVDSKSFDVFEGFNLYFHSDSLFAAVLHRSQPCH